ncbi:helix-turn-helix domain-containing protein [Kitasatospora sp. NPDC004723]|uniref:helix-turn-helix domain-containing protein n=1 Tax=Kitasatospora sp. NPDC004723 TaxID=3154288 RepID=UPI00339E86B7
MIQIRLTTDDLDRIRVAESPDFGYELALSGRHLVVRPPGRQLSAWRLDVARAWNPRHNRLFDLYTDLYLPAFFDEAVQPAPAPVDSASPPAVAHLRDLARSSALTPFTRALAEGNPRAATALDRILAGLRATALDPYRRRISSLVATASATTRAHAAVGGPDGLLRSIHPSVDWDGRHLRLNTRVDSVDSLEGRPLIFQPSALATGITFNPLADAVIVSYPTAATPLTRDPELHAPPRALQSLLGTTRAAALVAVARTPALTTGRLAATLGVSPAAASRHASVLRDAGLIATIRNGQTVHHHPTRLGLELAHGTAADQSTQDAVSPSGAV